MPRVRCEVSVADVKVNVAQATIVQWANEPNGPVFVDLLDPLATRVQFSARARVGFHTGRLHNSIRKQRRNGSNPTVAVVAGLSKYTPYLGYHLFGTPPHEIRAIPNRPNAHLRWVDSHGVHFRKRVWHPGTAPNPFLQRALDELAL